MENLLTMEFHEERRNIGETDTEMLAVAVENLLYLPWSCMRRGGSSGKVDTGSIHNSAPPKHKF
jgi:hypothetical protein